MGVNSVFFTLQEAFPQVDNRYLRAVAIEHSKDVDAAAEAVLMNLDKFSKEAGPSGSSVAVEAPYHPGTGEATPLLEPIHSNETTGPLNDSSFSNANGNNDRVYSNEELISVINTEASCLESGLGVTSSATSITAAQENTADDMNNRVQVNFATEVNGSFIVDHGSAGSSASLANEDPGGFPLHESQNFTVPSASESLVVVSGECHQGQLCEDDTQLKAEDSLVQVASIPVQGSSSDDPEGSIQLAAKQTMDTEELEPSSVVSIVSNNEVSSSAMAVDFGNDSALDSVVTRSAQVCSVDLLEEIIEDARNNKKTLFSAMESVISMMREVELQEKATEQAKEEALRGGIEIHSRMEELKQMLRHAKEANDMHAGEVYGEKAILATEVRELQSRLLSLSDERSKSLAILDEMRQTIEERLDAAEKERKAAEKDKLEKEALARDALAEQERIMEKVVQESKMLKQQAEENSKLQDFLMDRGRVVDTLQGEISVICQDVMLLKQKFDERVPLSKSLSSSQTTCLLASSSSSLRSVASGQFQEQADESPLLFSVEKKLSHESSSTSDHQFPQRREGSLSPGRKDRNALMDDGWEFFDSAEMQDAILD